MSIWRFNKILQSMLIMKQIVYSVEINCGFVFE